MTGVIYARYSSDSQREESIEGQLRECMEYARAKGITIVGRYIDRALSAKTANRPDFQRMISDGERGLFDAVIVWKLDRFSRNRHDHQSYKKILFDNGIRVISATENISEGPDGILMESLLEGFAEYYSAELAQKIRRGQTDNAMKCKYNGGTVPLGYVIDSDKYYAIDPVTAPVVLEIFTKYTEGTTAKEICDSLNERGVRTQRNNAFNRSSLHRMLRNRRYTGVYIYRDIEVPGGIPAIIPQALFDKVQEKLGKNKEAPAREKADVRYLLTTKLYCGKCGARMVGESGTSHTGQVYHYYKCANSKRKKDCAMKSLPKDWIEGMVVDYVVSKILGDDVIERMADAVMTLQKADNTVLPALRRQLKEVEKGIENMLNAIQQGIITPSTKQRLNDLEAAQENLKISIIQEEMRRPTLTREDVIDWIGQFQAGDKNSGAFRQRLIDAFVNAVYVYDDGIVVTCNYKERSNVISLAEVRKAFEAKRKKGSDLRALAPPKDTADAERGLLCLLVENRKNGLEARAKHPVDALPGPGSAADHSRVSGGRRSGESAMLHQSNMIRTRYRQVKGSDLFMERKNAAFQSGRIRPLYAQTLLQREKIHL